MIADAWEEIAPARSIWLITLTDLALLLVGFFAFLQANQSLDRKALMAGLRSGFGVQQSNMPARTLPEGPPKSPPPIPPMSVATARVDGFAASSAVLPDTAGVVAWARDAARDPRTRITVTGSTEGLTDIDPMTASAAILAADRARAVAATLVRSGGADPARIHIVIEPDRRRAVTLSVGFAGAAN